MKNLLIIDSYGILFRCFYAINYQIIGNGVNINAVSGFLNSVLQIFDEVDHSNLVFALDGGGKGFRHKDFPDYKSNRGECPSELIHQFDILDELLDCMGVFSKRSSGLEADDVINTFANCAKNKGIKSIIVTFDKDLSQLICDEVCVFNPKKKNFIHKEEVIKTFGVNPEKISEFLALTGDSIDNIPGVFGIGPKKASDLINKYGSIDGIYENIEKIENEKLKNIILDGKESAFLSLKLTKLIFDQDVEKAFNIDNMQKFDKNNPSEKFVNFLYKYNLKSVIKKLKLENYKIKDNDDFTQGLLF